EYNYILYEYANNAYAYAMSSEHLPYKNLKFEDNVNLHEILNTPDEYYKGYIVEVDLHFPLNYMINLENFHQHQNH
ncbi:MAG: hypothetical protein ACKPKO_55970, partial [Candidatus Fonsibacter sp.]